MSIDVRDPRFLSIVRDDTKVERLATGFDFTEGPVWHPHDKFLIFSDMPGDHMRRWTAAEGISTFRKPCNMANGNAYDRQGRLLTCEHASSRVSRTEPDGTIVALATHYRGKELNSPNDIVVRSDGTIFFTDPDFGRRAYYGVPRESQLGFRGLYMIRPNGELRLLVDDFGQPNGLCFSLDERRLFVNDSPRRHIRVFDVDDGGVSGGDLWAETGGAEGERTPDGMKIDSAGNLFCVGPGGIHVFDGDGERLGVILVRENVANFAWGEDDLKSLLITASKSLYSLRVEVSGLPAF
ncbi:MAG TPA: SMP-30/gluconolactonase/LRE family protein [Propylenella sp.]|nr:SMP-30/gluconolactonase/LRE family protein [Propylenella sp.]